MSKKQTIPIKAKDEIMSILASDMKISTDKVMNILSKYRVSGKTDALQRSYRRRIAQRFMASMRDESGKREILAVYTENDGIEYVVVNGCNDSEKLKAIQYRIHSHIAGLENTSGKVQNRLRFVERFSRFAPLFGKRVR